MKKITSLFMVVVFALSLCACVDNSAKQDVLSHADNSQTTAIDPKGELPSQKATATEASTEKSSETKKEETEAPESVTSAESVLPDVTGIWSHVKTNGHHSVNITYQDSNTITMTITAIRGQAAQIAIAEVTVDMVTDANGSKGTFYYEDSFLNQGQGEIIIYDSDNLTLNLYQDDNVNGGWCVAAAAGDYTKA